MTWLSSFYATGIVVCLYLVPIVLIVTFTLIYKKFIRRHRHSPLTTDLLRPAGLTLQKQIDELQWDLMEIFFVIPMLTTLVPLALLVGEKWFAHPITQGTWIWTTTLAMATLGYYIWKTVRTVKRLTHLRLGYACEMAVGQELAQLLRPEDRPYRLYHDIPFAGFNVDHLAITPTGVFVIETKGRSKPVTDGNKQFKVRLEGDALHFPNHMEKEPLEQTRRNVKSVRLWLREATGFDVPVAGVLVLPGWFVERKQRSVDPYVMNGVELSKQLPQLHVGTLELGQIQAIAHQVAQRVRDVDRDRAW